MATWRSCTTPSVSKRRRAHIVQWSAYMACSPFAWVWSGAREWPNAVRPASWFARNTVLKWRQAKQSGFALVCTSFFLPVLAFWCMCCCPCVMLCCKQDQCICFATLTGIYEIAAEGDWVHARAPVTLFPGGKPSAKVMAGIFCAPPFDDQQQHDTNRLEEKVARLRAELERLEGDAPTEPRFGLFG